MVQDFGTFTIKNSCQQWPTKIPIPYELHFLVFCVTLPETITAKTLENRPLAPQKKHAHLNPTIDFQGSQLAASFREDASWKRQVVVLRRRILWLCTSLSGDSLIDWLQTHRADGTTGVGLTCRPNDSGLVVVPTPPLKNVKMDGFIVSGPGNHLKPSLKLPPISP